MVAFGFDAAKAAQTTHHTLSYDSLRLHVIAHQFVLIAQVHAAADDDRMRPAGLVSDVMGAERAVEVIAPRRGFDQRDFATLVAKNQVAVGIGNGRGAAAGAALVAAPDDFAASELEAGRKAVAVLVAKINVAVFENHLTM